jgi:two-component system chemotaxis sensor kinase CheA
MARDPYRYFRVEARELLDRLMREVLALERGVPLAELADGILRIAHTLKGAARVVKRPDIADHAHAIEDLVAEAQVGELFDVKAMLARVDAMVDLVNHLDAPEASEAKPQEAPEAAPPREADRLDSVRLDVSELDSMMEGLSASRVQASLLADEVAEVGRLRGRAGLLVDALRAASSGADSLALAVADELDALHRRLSAAVGALTMEVDQVAEDARRLRLLPVAPLFSVLERAARDAAADLGWAVAFRAEGGDARLDGHVLSSLRDVFLHIVRNAVAHGGQAAGDRRRAGKTDALNVALRAERRGERVIFTCSDDGRGIDLAEVREAAVRRGVIDATRAAALDDEACLDLIFQPGLSTSANVSQVAGRGVGLDVVREVVARLKGEVAVRTMRGAGTSIEVSVPLSLSSVRVLIADSSEGEVSIPLDAVRRIERVGAEGLVRGSEGDALVSGQQSIPFAPLDALLWGSAAVDAGRSAVVLEVREQWAAIGVRRIRGIREEIVHRLPTWAAASPLVGGASFDAHWRPRLVLHPAALIGAARRHHAPPGEAAPARLPILVIDDSLTTRMLEQSILETAGYEVDLATSAEEALEMASGRRYGVFVCDVEMPGMDGFEFVARTRGDADLRAVPAILVTSRGSDDDRRKGMEAGAIGYIVKGDFDERRLLSMIGSILS